VALYECLNLEPYIACEGKIDRVRANRGVGTVKVLDIITSLICMTF
jgi:hypothetical protein